MSRSRVKSMLNCFFSEQIVNAKFYVDVLDRSRKRVLCVRPNIVDSWKLHRATPTPPRWCWPHHADCEGVFGKHRVAAFPHHPYSPDLAPPDLFHFPRLKRDFNGNRYSSVDNVKKVITASLKRLPENELQTAFVHWESRYTRCVGAQGCYFEKY